MPKKKKDLDLSDEQKDPLVAMDEEDEEDEDILDMDPKKLKSSGLHIEGAEDDLIDLDADIFEEEDPFDDFDDEFGDEKDEW